MTSPGTNKHQPLTQRDRQVLEHVARYRMTTISALRRAVLSDISENAVGKIASRLCAGRFLNKHPLAHPACYFVLGPNGTKALGMGLHRATPLGPQSLPVEYGVLLHCLLGQQPRHRLTLKELLELWSWLPSPLNAAPHCLDTQNNVLELIRVDLGGPADHVARKVARDVTRRRQLTPFLSAVRSGQFRLVLVTATRGKAQALRQALSKHEWPTGMQLHLSVVPLLLSLITRSSHA